jgi:phosphoribosyl 1,2-cyclic phosphate phosphodiesterase
MKVTFLGTGTSTGVPVPTCECRVCVSADPRDQRLRPSVLLQWDDANVLIDTATDLRTQALRHSIRRIDAVLYTHAHADHVLGLDELRLYNWRQGGAVPAYGSPATLAALSRTFWYVFDEAPAEHTRPLVERRPVQGPFTLLRREVIAVPLLHGTLEILGYRLGRFAYLTDVSRIPEPSYALLQGLDVLVLNALRSRPHPTHLDLEHALQEALRIGARQTYFTHLSHEVHHESVSARLPAGTALAHDGLSFEVEDD